MVPRPSRQCTGGATRCPLLPPNDAVVVQLHGACSSSPAGGLVDLNFILPKPVAFSSSPTEKQGEISNVCFTGSNFGGPRAHSDGLVVSRDTFSVVCVLIAMDLSSWDPIPVVHVLIALIVVLFMVQSMMLSMLF